MLFGFVMGVCLTANIIMNTYLVVSAKKNYDRRMGN